MSGNGYSKSNTYTNTYNKWGTEFRIERRLQFEHEIGIQMMVYMSWSNTEVCSHLKLMLMVININESFFRSVIRASDLSCFFQYTASIVMVLLSTAGKKKVWLLSHNRLCFKLLLLTHSYICQKRSVLLLRVLSGYWWRFRICQVETQESPEHIFQSNSHTIHPWQSSHRCDLLKNSLQSSMFFISMLWSALFCIKINCTMTDYIEMMPVSLTSIPQTLTQPCFFSNFSNIYLFQNFCFCCNCSV